MARTTRGFSMSRDVFPTLSQISSDGSLTIEIAIRPLKIYGVRTQYILSFFSDAGLPVLVFGAWKSTLMVQIIQPEAEQGLKKTLRIWLGDSLALEGTLFVTIVARQQGTSLYQDGSLRGDYPDARFLAGVLPIGRLLLGNSPTGKNGWKGDILSVAVYKRALSTNEVANSHAAWANGKPPELSAQEALIAHYDFSEGAGAVAGSKHGLRDDLLIPTTFKPPRRIVLAPPPQGAKLTQIINLDGVFNILGFMPFGFLAMSAIGLAPRITDRWRSLIVVCSGFAFSLAIELAQVFIPARNSSLTDLCANTIGTATGVLLFFVLTKRAAGCAVEARIGEG
jgi:VanZ family protein